MKKARFPHHKDFASFDYTQSVVDPALLNTLSSGDFTRAAENILFIGGTGTGKTHLATAPFGFFGDVFLSKGDEKSDSLMLWI